MTVQVDVPKQSRAGDSVCITVNVPAFGQVKTNVRVPDGKRGGDVFMATLGTREDLAEKKKEEGNQAYKVCFGVPCCYK